MTERELQDAVVEAARLLGWRIHHARPARTAKGWRTPIQGDPGFPDLVLARGWRRDARLLFRELKTGRGQLSRDQAQWLVRLRLAGADVDVWTDEDWRSGRIEEELRA